MTQDVGHIFIDGVIDDGTLSEVKQQIQASAGKSKLLLRIASPGGSVYAGYKIYHALKAANKPIETIIEGEAQSMATFIALAGDKISICNPSVFMIHNPRQSMQGSTASDLIKGANELIPIEEEMANAYVRKTNLPLDKVKDMMSKETTLTAQQAKDLKFVDEVVDGHYLKAVAIGKPIKKNMEKTLKEKVLAMVAGIISNGPTAMDVETDKGMLNVQSEDGEFVGKPVTLNGQPASGSFALKDGRTLVAEGGVVTEVKAAAQASPTPAPAPAPTPAPAPAQTAEQRLAAMEAEFQKLKAEAESAATAKAAAEEAAKVAAQEKEKAVQALGQIKKELEAEPVGDQTAPNKGPAMIAPNARGPVAAQERDRTMKFFAEHMPWIFQYYPEKEVAAYSSGPNMVSILETNFNYTWPGILTTEIFYKPTLQAPALSDIFTIDQGIKDRKRYNLVTQLDKILRPYTGCDRTFNGNRQLITNTTVQTKEFQVSESWCKDDFTGQLTGAYNILAQEWLKTGNRSFDPSGTPINTVIDRVLADALQRDVFRRVSFAAGNSSDVDYNQIDGLWDRLIDSSGASNYCVRRAGSALTTAALSAGNALTHLETTYASSNVLLKNAPGKKFFVTRSIWDNYYNSLIGTGAVTEQAFENLQKGLTTLTYKGIPVIPVDLWDSFLAESDNPLFGTTAHLILLTVKENHILGVEQGSDLNKIEGWYERKDRKFYYESDMKFGYNYLHCDLQTIMY
jgi:ATP-dependent Clp endopeptidase proteolytic subunit ClpP